MPALVDDLIAYVNRADLDPVREATIAHARFEVIRACAAHGMPTEREPPLVAGASSATLDLRAGGR